MNGFAKGVALMVIIARGACTTVYLKDLSIGYHPSHNCKRINRLRFNCPNLGLVVIHCNPKMQEHM